MFGEVFFVVRGSWDATLFREIINVISGRQGGRFLSVRIKYVLVNRITSNKGMNLEKKYMYVYMFIIYVYTYRFYCKSMS